MNFITVQWRKLSVSTRAHIHNLLLGGSMMILIAVQTRMFLDRPTGHKLFDMTVIGFMALFYLMLAPKIMKNPYKQKKE